MQIGGRCGVSTGNRCSVVRLGGDVRMGYKLSAARDRPLAPPLTLHASSVPMVKRQ